MRQLFCAIVAKSHCSDSAKVNGCEVRGMMLLQLLIAILPVLLGLTAALLVAVILLHPDGRRT
jgi:hypothetical protein